MQLSNPHEQFCFDTAVMFTAIRGRRPSNRIRCEFDTFEAAKASGVGDNKTMIYAVNDLGNSAHICNV